MGMNAGSSSKTLTRHRRTSGSCRSAPLLGHFAINSRPPNTLRFSCCKKGLPGIVARQRLRAPGLRHRLFEIKRAEIRLHFSIEPNSFFPPRRRISRDTDLPPYLNKSILFSIPSCFEDGGCRPYTLMCVELNGLGLQSEELNDRLISDGAPHVAAMGPVIFVPLAQIAGVPPVTQIFSVKPFYQLLISVPIDQNNESSFNCPLNRVEYVSLIHPRPRAVRRTVAQRNRQDVSSSRGKKETSDASPNSRKPTCVRRSWSCQV